MTAGSPTGEASLKVEARLSIRALSATGSLRNVAKLSLVPQARPVHSRRRGNSLTSEDKTGGPRNRQHLGGGGRASREPTKRVPSSLR